MARNKKQSIYKIPEDDLREYRRLVQRANRQIYKNMKYIQQENIKSESTQRALLGHKADRAAWVSDKTPFSRAIKFKPITTANGRTISGEEQYKQYRRMLERFGGDSAEHTPEAMKERYYQSIVRSLTTLAESSGATVMTKKGHLPKAVTNAIKSMTLEQMTHYFDEGDPSDDLDYIYYKWEDYDNVTSRKEFVDLTKRQINRLKEIYPVGGKKSTLMDIAVNTSYKHVKRRK